MLGHDNLDLFGQLGMTADFQETRQVISKILRNRHNHRLDFPGVDRGQRTDGKIRVLNSMIVNAYLLRRPVAEVKRAADSSGRLHPDMLRSKVTVFPTAKEAANMNKMNKQTILYRSFAYLYNILKESKGQFFLSDV